MSATSWAQFGPDTVPISSLPPQFMACLQGEPTEACDELVGSAPEGFGYCSQLPYSRLTYCSCVNNSVPCPQVNMSVCANTAFAYKPYAWSQGTPSLNSECRSAPVCINMIEVGGSQNIANNVKQSCSLGEATTNAAGNAAAGAPYMFVLLLVLFILLAIIASVHTTDREEELEKIIKGLQGK